MDRPTALADVRCRVRGSNASLLKDSMTDEDGMMGGGGARCANSTDVDGASPSVKAAGDRLMAETWHAKPVLPGKNCGVCKALNDVPPTVTDSGLVPWRWQLLENHGWGRL